MERRIPRFRPFPSGAFRAVDVDLGTEVEVFRQGNEKKPPFRARIGRRIATGQVANLFVELVRAGDALPLNRIGAGTCVCVIRR